MGSTVTYGPGTATVTYANQTANYFFTTGTIVAFTVPQTGTYYIEADGGSGGGYAYYSNDNEGYSYLGGAGGSVSGNFALVQGETLDIIVGGGGYDLGYIPYGAGFYGGEVGSGGGGGGGASSVVLVQGTTQTILEVAGGGGGGAAVFPSTPTVGGGGGAAVSPSTLTVGGAGGAGPAGNGSGGSATDDGAGGGGFYGSGANGQIDPGASPASQAIGGSAINDGAAGGAAGALAPGIYGIAGGTGGYGGGGGGGTYGGGGGGGYTGGSSGQGGTSFIAANAVNPVLISGVDLINGEVQIIYPACFVAGTRISIPGGYAVVETLKVGDMVLSERRGLPVEVRWVGSSRIDCTGHPAPSKVLPVRISADAFGRCLPARDLFLSPDHAVFAEGVLIPVRALVNGCSIAQQGVARVTYWHVEVDQHDVLLAEGLPVESYLDTGQRAAFIGGLVTALMPDFTIRVWEAQGCAPLRVTGPEVDAVRARLEAQRAAQRAAQAA